MTRTVRLTERRPRAVKLPRREVGFLLASARHLIDVVPAFARGTYTLTPRGFVGFLNGPTTRYAIRPKIDWPNLLLLLGLGSEPASNRRERDPESGLLRVLATAFAERLEAVARTGLVGGHNEVESVSAFLRGRLRAAAQMRDAATRAFPGHFHIDEPTFDLNTPWNRIANATARTLGERSELPAALRGRIAVAAQPLASVTTSVAEADFQVSLADPRAAGYKSLLDVCDLIHRGFLIADPHQTSPGAFLLDLGHAFERYLIHALGEEFAARTAWSVVAHPGFTLGPASLRPDVLLRKCGTARVVLDAKWKATLLDPADLHQVLAYATLTGAPRVGLVYPGRTDARATFATPDGKVRVTRYRLRVVGTATELASSLAKLARDTRRR